jgi:mannosyltransferase OCH1-like enzyme
MKIIKYHGQAGLDFIKKFKKNNKNILQFCIGLNDEIESLKEAKKKIISQNPTYTYHYIDSEDKMHKFMEHFFRDSKDPFDQKIYESFYCVPMKLKIQTQRFPKGWSKKQQEDQANVCRLVSRTDIIRYAFLYKFGGLYLDLSSCANVDIDKDFSKYDFVGFKSPAEVRSSCLYGKKNNLLTTKILKRITDSCNLKTENNSLGQMKYAGPGAITNTLISMTDYSIKPSTYKESLKFIDVKKYNILIEDEKGGQKFFKMQGPWKKELHHPSKKNPNKKINGHWLHP